MSYDDFDYEADEARHMADDGPDQDEEPGLCTACSGSGEGQFDGTTCRVCKGLGEV